MRKNLKIFGLLLLLIFMTACNDNVNVEVKPDDNPEDIPNVEPVTKKDFQGISIYDETFDYNGNTHSIYCNNIPSFASVTYLNNEKTEPGVYEVIANITAEGYNSLTLKAEMKIVGKFDNLTMDDVTVKYDGKSHTIKLDNVPNYARTTYSGKNSYTNPGEYDITIVVTAKNYETKTLTAKLTILPLEFEDLKFDSYTVMHDNYTHKLEVEGAPNKATIIYSYNSTNQNAFKEIGKYQVKAIISMENYKTVEMTAELEIVNPVTISVDNTKECYKIDETLKWDNLYNELLKGNYTVEVESYNRFEYNDGSINESDKTIGTYGFDNNKIYYCYMPPVIKNHSQPIYEYARIYNEYALLSKLYYVENETGEIAHYKYDKDTYFSKRIEDNTKSILKYLTKTEDGGFAEGSYFSYVTNYGSYEIKDNCFIVKTYNNYYHPEGTNHEIQIITIKNIGNTIVNIPECMNPIE